MNRYIKAMIASLFLTAFFHAVGMDFLSFYYRDNLYHISFLFTLLVCPPSYFWLYGISIFVNIFHAILEMRHIKVHGIWLFLFTIIITALEYYRMLSSSRIFDNYRDAFLSLSLDLKFYIVFIPIFGTLVYLFCLRFIWKQKKEQSFTDVL